MGDNQIPDSGYPKDNHISASIGPTEKYDLPNYIRISWERHYLAYFGGNVKVSGHKKGNNNTSFLILVPKDKSNSPGISRHFLWLSYG